MIPTFLGSNPRSPAIYKYLMFLDTDICEVGKINYRSEKLITELESYNWLDTYDSYLKNTGAIFYPFKLGKCDLFYNHGNVNQKELLIISLTVPLLKELNLYFPNYKFIKGEIYCSYPDTEQQLHIDPKVFHRYCNRIHIPLITNDHSFLQIDDNHYHLESYKVYNFNNMKLHRSYNRGSTNRIHIVVDIMDNFYYKKFVDSGNYSLLFERSDYIGKDLEYYYNSLTL